MEDYSKMRKLLRFLKSYKLETILGPFFKLLEACFELIIPLIVADIIDNGIANSDRQYIISRCLIMASLGFIGLICAISAQYFAAKAATGFSAKLRLSLYDHIQRLSPTEKDFLGTSTLITRMTSDINQIQSGLNLVLRLFLRSPFIVLGSMVMAFTVDSKLGLIFAVTIPILSVVVFGIMLISIPLYKKVQSRLDKVTLETRENLNGTRVVRAFNHENAAIESFDKANTAHTRLQMSTGRLSALMNPLTYVIINIALVILIDKGSVHVDTGIITQGELFALVSYMSQILIELIKLANLLINIIKAVACGNRVQSIFDIPEGMEKLSEESTSMPEHNGYIEFDNVELTYRNAGEPTLTNINVTVGKGQTVGVIGATGSGKSSFVNMIPRFYDATKGAVYVNGKDVRTVDTETLRSEIGVVPQKAVLFKGTVRSNLLWGNEGASDDEMWDALELAQAADFIKKKEGLDTNVLQKGSNFSGGQRQRLTIARALVRRPEILILDDSTSALDLATDAALRRAIAGLDYSPTVFIVSQRASSVRNADIIVVLEDGEIVGLGTHDELIRSCEVYIEIYRSQFGDDGVSDALKASENVKTAEGGTANA